MPAPSPRFAAPKVQHRRRLWQRNLPAALPVVWYDIDIEFLARRFTLSGGNIRNVAVGAAFRAAVGQRRVAMADLVRETAREYRELWAASAWRRSSACGSA